MKRNEAQRAHILYLEMLSLVILYLLTQNTDFISITLEYGSVDNTGNTGEYL